MKNLEFKGIGASSGVVKAKVFKIEEVDIKIDHSKIEDTEKEIALYKKALEKSIQQIETIKEKAKNKLKQEELDILDAHILIANDPMINEEIIELINQKENAVHATDLVAKKYIEMFLSMDDEYMRGRALDIKDLTTRIIKNLLNIDLLDLSLISEDIIIVANDLTPSDTAQLNSYVKGFLTNIGSRTSHSAIMARSLEIPAILALKDITQKVENGDTVVINGDTGIGVINPSDNTIQEYEKQYQEYIKLKHELETYKNKESVSKDGKKVVIAANIGNVEDLEAVLHTNADEIGLFRSEFLYMDANNWPTEEEQFQVYKTVLERMNNKKVVVRTLDIGGDKTLKYFNFAKELNPFLGYRAIRLSLDRIDVFVTQLRALIRASEFGNLAIMFPMIATVDEFLQAKAIFDKTFLEVKQEFVNVKDDIKVGIMIEIPAAAMIADQLAKYVDFFSIGTNDLIQYSMAADRMNEKVTHLYQPLNPSILKLIKLTIDGAHKHNKWVGMCGEMAGDIYAVPILLGMGLDEFSMSASSILKVKKLIYNTSYEKYKDLWEQVKLADRQSEVEKILKIHPKR
ncbi:phosphoenolpyruvate--protein phosphotransferase [Mesomycoplasma hyorhinis]|uniref:phosphoenolpyruvate--protein phosphotransferase n=1 Tax=Mesomycoplasma hyorhinis TaxID=2100 RepID=UPI001C059130|nr:phosphoenolpyruvate--protein phosphotransferase [Mesomycoplasma hyorhinis]